MFSDEYIEIIRFWLIYNLSKGADFDISDASQFIEIKIPDSGLEKFMNVAVWIAPGGRA